MSYVDEIEIVEGTIGKDVNLQAQLDGVGVNLVGCVVKFKVYNVGDTTCLWLVTCIAVDLVLGKVRYALQSSDWGTGKPQGGVEYDFAIIATKTGYQEEFIFGRVRILEKPPET